MKHTKYRIIAVLCLILILTAVSGCGSKAGDTQNPQPAPVQPVPITKEVTLYFGDKQAEKLIPEKRQVQVPADEPQQVASAIVKELIAGPGSQELSKTIPAETKLLSLTIQDKIATVDFSAEIRTKHWGGSAGETFTIMSIVNSLTELPGIEKVQLLIAGQKEDTLVGHWSISGPISRDTSIIRK